MDFPRRNRRMVILALVAGVVAWWGLLSGSRIPDPEHRGLRASQWFRQLSRNSDGQSDDTVALRYWDAKLALVEMGTNAVPLLVERILAPDRDGPFRRLLWQVARQTPHVFPSGGFLPAGVVRDEALAVLEVARPPTDLVRPLVNRALKQDPVLRRKALRILARCRDDGGYGELALTELTNAVAPGAEEVNDLVRHLKHTDAAWVPPLVAAVDRPGASPAAIGILSRLGPAAAAAVPVLERVLAGTNESQHLRAAFALLEIVPGHSRAQAAVLRFGHDTTFSPWNGITQAAAIELCRDLGELLHVGHPVALEAVESLARRETEGWELRGLEERASSVLERVAPERAAPLFARQMVETNRTNVRIVAAQSLLRIQRTHVEAFRWLVELAGSGHQLVRMAASALGEVDPNWPEAQAAFTRLATNALEPSAQSLVRVSERRARAHGTRTTAH